MSCNKETVFVDWKLRVSKEIKGNMSQTSTLIANELNQKLFFLSISTPDLRSLQQSSIEEDNDM